MLGVNYEVAYYDANQNQLSFSDLSGNISDYHLFTPVSLGNQDFQDSTRSHTILP